MFRVSILVAVLIAGSGLTVYPQAKPLTPPAEQEPRPLSVPKDYRYNSRGRRDPFVNPVPKPIERAAPASASSSATGTVRPPGLRGVLVNEATIAGVVTSRDPSMTLVIIGA